MMMGLGLGRWLGLRLGLESGRGLCFGGRFTMRTFSSIEVSVNISSPVSSSLRLTSSICARASARSPISSLCRRSAF